MEIKSTLIKNFIWPVIVFFYFSCASQQIAIQGNGSAYEMAENTRDFPDQIENIAEAYSTVGELQLVERKERNGVMTPREEKIMEAQYAFYSGLTE